VAQPTPVVMQQYCIFSSDHNNFQLATPWLQSKGKDVVNKPDSSHHRRRSRSGSKQHVVMMHVKSLLCFTTSKSPPQPTYLYVVSCMYDP